LTSLLQEKIDAHGMKEERAWFLARALKKEKRAPKRMCSM
jgi:hypothetical protein